MKTALITGGSRGIGRALVERFAREGWRVAFGYHRHPENARDLAARTGTVAIHGDLADAQDTAHFLGEAIRQLGHVDALILNAGVAHSGLITDMTAEQWDSLMAVNLRASFLCARGVLPVMRAHGGGSVVMISSMWGRRGAAHEAAYSASKAALIGFAQALAREVGPCGIRVNCLAPGVIKTAMLDGYAQTELDALAEQTPLGRLGTPEEVAAAAWFLCSDDASFITGQTLAVDGGFL